MTDYPWKNADINMIIDWLQLDAGHHSQRYELILTKQQKKKIWRQMKDNLVLLVSSVIKKANLT